MSVNSYASIQALVADALARSDLTLQIIDAITLFEAEASYELFRTRGNETRTILAPSNPTALNITNYQAGPGGVIWLTYTPISTNTPLVTGNIVNVASVPTEGQGSWVVTVVDSSDIYLQNSVYVGPYTSGGTIQQDQGFAALPSNYLGWSRVTWTGVPTVDLEYVAPAVWDDEFPTWLPVVSSGIPEVFTVEAGFIKIRPISPTPLEFLYWAMTPALASSFNWLATNRPDAYVAGALAIVYGLWVKDPAQAQFYNSKKMEIFDQIKKQRFREFSNLRIRMDRSSYGTTP